MFVKSAVKLPKNEAVFRLEALVFKTLLDLHDSVFTSHESPIIFFIDPLKVYTSIDSLRN